MISFPKPDDASQHRRNSKTTYQISNSNFSQPIMSNMKRFFEDLQEIQRAQRSQPFATVDLPTILRHASDVRKEFWPDPDEEALAQKARDARAEDREFLGIR
jgi:hypothetical protein